MLNSPEGWAIHLRNLRAVWWSQCQVPCLHLLDFRPDLDQKMVDAIVSCLPKNTESTITILGYRHVNLDSTLLLTFLRMGCVFAWKWHPHKSTKTTKMATAVTWGYLMKDFPPCGGSYEPPRQKVGWQSPLNRSPSLPYLQLCGWCPGRSNWQKDRFLQKFPLFFNSQNFHCFWARSFLHLF
jgi:hypothetical protein